MRQVGKEDEMRQQLDRMTQELRRFELENSTIKRQVRPLLFCHYTNRLMRFSGGICCSLLTRSFLQLGSREDQADLVSVCTPLILQ